MARWSISALCSGKACTLKTCRVAPNCMVVIVTTGDKVSKLTSDLTLVQYFSYLIMGKQNLICAGQCSSQFILNLFQPIDIIAAPDQKLTCACCSQFFRLLAHKLDSTSSLYMQIMQPSLHPTWANLCVQITCI